MKIKILLSILAIFTLQVNANDNIMEVNYRNYENLINTQWEQLIKKYLEKEKNKTLDFNIQDKIYKDYVNKKLYEKEKWFNKNNIDNNFKILDEYNRLLNTTPIDKNIFPVWTTDNINANSNILSTPWYSYYNRTRAVSYATYWIWQRNSNYSYYSWLWNCTNFTSQVLKAWWVPDENNWTINWRTKKENWYYGSIFQAPTYTWWWAHNFFQHASVTTSKYQNINSFWQLQLWDIIQIDYWKTWTIRHSMIVSNITWAWTNNIYLTYSSDYDIPANDRLNTPLSSILQNYPQTSNNYYIWKIIY